jgi:hypothetical protein
VRLSNGSFPESGDALFEQTGVCAKRRVGDLKIALMRRLLNREVRRL